MTSSTGSGTRRSGWGHAAGTSSAGRRSRRSSSTARSRRSSTSRRYRSRSACPVREAGEWIAAGWDIAAILRAWCDHLQEAGFELVLEPTPSRGRTLRNLTVNVFHPLELLAGAGETGRFDWDPDLDEERERRLADAPALNAYARRGRRRLARLPAELRRGARRHGGLHAARRARALGARRFPALACRVSLPPARPVHARPRLRGPGAVPVAPDLGLPDEVF